MFKSNLSPFNQSKDKLSNQNYIPSNNGIRVNKNCNQNNFHLVKNNYNGVENMNQKYEITYQKYEIGSDSNLHPHLNPLSSNIIKTPMSPTSKIKIFSNNLTLNKKGS